MLKYPDPLPCHVCGTMLDPLKAVYGGRSP